MSRFPITRLRIRLLLSAALISSALIVGLSFEALAGCTGEHKSTPDQTALTQPAPVGPERTEGPATADRDARTALPDIRGIMAANDAVSIVD
ncbi:hypothetical protein KAJ83_11090 [Marivibrio halodurans]|uniref:Uncharacterized protein n=1 Tax=Marivibrio halodurans TaxID=2039722 RepID=A0A8J7SNB3_9PROT|nr:hypothetical protein [Marivibrio halodurans]MBP5857556.1 hypothetical protein [Marivibrio halodurans]